MPGCGGAAAPPAGGRARPAAELERSSAAHGARQPRRQRPSASAGAGERGARRRAAEASLLRFIVDRLNAFAAPLALTSGATGAVRGLAVAAAVPRPLAPLARGFRFWIDFQAFSSPESAALPEAALAALGGVRTGGPPKLDPVTAAVQKIRDYGYMHMDAWDLLLSITAKAMLAAEVLRPHQVVSIVPGCLAISRKTSLVRSLLNAYGPDLAFSIVPRTFKLPDELDAWADWLAAHPDQDTGLWMLKNNKQRGTGLRLVPTRGALAACFETTTRPGLEGVPLYRWYLAQQYVADPLLINARKFGIRLWVTLPGVDPLRVYLHTNGLALFSAAPYAPADAVRGDWGCGHITNYAQNENGDVWDLPALAAHMGHSAWKARAPVRPRARPRRARAPRAPRPRAHAPAPAARLRAPRAAQPLWARLARATALVFASALRRIGEVHAALHLGPRQCFQYFGLDFLLDSTGRPWLMEVNATPSMKVAHDHAPTAELIAAQKGAFVADTFALLRLHDHGFDEARRGAAARAAAEPSPAQPPRVSHSPLRASTRATMRATTACLALACAVLLSAAAPAAAAGDRFVKERVVVDIDVGDGKTFALRLPRFLPTNKTSGNVFRRTYDDTCGLFDILNGELLTAGQGPPPHVHYYDDEWFFVIGEGSVRMYAGHKPKAYFPGQLPGHNAPVNKMGAASIKKGDMLYSPRNQVHYFSTENKVTDFIQVHAYGYAMPLIIAAAFDPEIGGDPRRFLEYTGLYGIPHDLTGKMVGMKPLPTPEQWPPSEGDYRSASGPVQSFPAQLKRLQAMFDASERCYPKNV
ncbi:Ttll6a [Scenedesmus sp. PABB004]|nr:Ttll6a [Scenedesmus sp. PABB004]